MTFKEQVEKDRDEVFLNLDEFAELHRIEGSEIPVVIDDDLLNKYKKGVILGVVEADMLIFGKVEDFPADMDPGRPVNVDGRELTVDKVGRAMGMIEVTLNQTRTG